MTSKLLPLPNSANPAKKMPAVGFGMFTCLYTTLGTLLVPWTAGSDMPIICSSGTWQAKAGEVEKAVETALKAGYKHIDCAAIYGNENEVGEGIRASGVDPNDIWMTSKVCSFFRRLLDRYSRSHQVQY